MLRAQGIINIMIVREYTLNGRRALFVAADDERSWLLVAGSGCVI